MGAQTKYSFMYGVCNEKGLALAVGDTVSKKVNGTYLLYYLLWYINM